MAGSFINVEIDDTEIVAMLKRLQDAIGDMPAALREIGEDLLLSTRRRWDQGIDPQGNPWERPLSDVTLAKKRKNKDKILVEEGDLQRNIAPQIEGDALLVGTNLKYGAAHQFGMKQGYAGRGSYKARKGSFPIP